MARRGASVRALVSGPSVGIFGAELAHLPALSVPDDIAIEDVSRFLLENRANVLLTGAGAYNQIEHTCRLAARANSIPGIAVLDYWFEYEARFHRTHDGTTVESYPGIVCALDNLSREGLLAAGLKPEQVVVTGGPNLEETLHWWEDIDADRSAALRVKYGITASELSIVFFSEPYYTAPQGLPLTGPGGLFRADGTPVFGYTASEILKMVITSLLSSSLQAQRRVHLLVKPHPLEWQEALRLQAMQAQSEWLKTDFLDEAHPKELMAASDVVIGMSSIALLEAALVGKLALSVQVGLRQTRSLDPCIGNALGYTVPVFDSVTLDRVMSSACRGTAGLRPKPARRLNLAGAAARVADLVLLR
ncbi:MAG: hypothetical protein WCC06_03910 [Candidatus Aminicenantales bacterium]